MPENPIYLNIEQRLVCIIFSKVWSIFWVFISHSWPVLPVGYGGTPSEMASIPCLEGYRVPPLSKPKHTVREHLKNKPKMFSIQINPDLWYLGIWIPSLESGIKKWKTKHFQDDVLDYLMKQPNIMPRLNDRILGKDSATYIDLNGDAIRSLKVPKSKINLCHPLITFHRVPAS